MEALTRRLCCRSSHISGQIPIVHPKFLRDPRRVGTELPSLIARDGIGFVDAALGGAGIARVYDLAARPYVAEGNLETVLSDWSCGRESIYAVFPSRRHLPAKVRIFLDFAHAFVHRFAQSGSR